MDNFFFYPISCMIYLEKNIQTNIALTLSESSQLQDPHFLFVFKNEINGTETIETFMDISGYPESYNLFSMQLDYISGQYKYTVYEAFNPGPTVLAETTGNIVETGIMIIHSEEEVNNNIYL